MFHKFSHTHTHTIYMPCNYIVCMNHTRAFWDSRNLRPRDGVTAEAPTVEEIHGFQQVALEGFATKATTCTICLEDLEIGEGTEQIGCRFGCWRFCKYRSGIILGILWHIMAL